MGPMLPSPARALATLSPHGVPGVRDVVRGRLAELFGPPPLDPAADPGDPGLFGPGSASWRIIAEPAAIVGGIRSLLVQLLHPPTMAGVHDHSAFREDPLGRLHRTAGYVTTTTFGSTREALRVAQRVRGAHVPVVGVDPDGSPYRAGDPWLLAWVSMALTSSFLATDRAFAPDPVDAATADAFVAEQARAAALLDPRVDLRGLATDEAALADLRTGRLTLPLVAEGHVPTSVAELTVRMAAYAPELRLGEQAREALRFLLWPELPATIRAGYLPLLGGAVATLDPDQRRLLRLSRWGLAVAPLRAQAAVLLTAVRVGSGVSPSARLAAARAGAAA